MTDLVRRPPSPDAVELALEHLQPRSAGLIVREAFYGTTRFDDFLARTKVTRSVLAAQLERLTHDQILQRVAYREDGRRTRNEYQLTAKGRELGTALIALIDWSSTWAPPPDEKVFPQHRGCGAVAHTAIYCDAGHHDISVHDITPAGLDE